MTMNHLEDLEAIRTAKIAYARCFDAGDLDGVIDMFTDDATVDAGHYGSARGAADIRVYFAESLAAVNKTLHYVSNPTIEFVDADNANGTWYLMDVMLSWAETGKPAPMLIGTYNDSYKRVNGKWKISRMKVDIRWPLSD